MADCLTSVRLGDGFKYRIVSMSEWPTRSIRHALGQLSAEGSVRKAAKLGRPLLLLQTHQFEPPVDATVLRAKRSHADELPCLHKMLCQDFAGNGVIQHLN